jgi:hypothetical protein
MNFLAWPDKEVKRGFYRLRARSSFNPCLWLLQLYQIWRVQRALETLASSSWGQWFESGRHRCHRERINGREFNTIKQHHYSALLLLLPAARVGIIFKWAICYIRRLWYESLHPCRYLCWNLFDHPFIGCRGLPSPYQSAPKDQIVGTRTDTEVSQVLHSQLGHLALWTNIKH